MSEENQGQDTAPKPYRKPGSKPYPKVPIKVDRIRTEILAKELNQRRRKERELAGKIPPKKPKIYRPRVPKGPIHRTTIYLADAIRERVSQYQFVKFGGLKGNMTAMIEKALDLYLTSEGF